MGEPETQLVPSSSPVPARRHEDFPPDVHASLATLRAIAKQAKSRNDPSLRWATEDEIALSDALRAPWHCSGHSSRTGLACTKPRLTGAAVCRFHGAGTKAARVANERRIQRMAVPLIGRAYELAMQKDNLTVAQKATADLLDRAAVGAPVQAKISQQGNQPSINIFDSKIHICIGYLDPELHGGPPPEQPYSETETTVSWRSSRAFALYQQERQQRLAALNGDVIDSNEATGAAERGIIPVSPGAVVVLRPADQRS